ncbi:hypothetical protein [Acinetobacter sp. c3-l95]|uniref:hypothetical protein n=1 Tax=Acinetobacter sp. c3-l95 TaxID=3342804 RepID=UPI0035BB147D
MTKDEALTLIEIHGLERSKEIVKNCPEDCTHYSWQLGDSGVLDKTVCIADLKQALQIVEGVNDD